MGTWTPGPGATTGNDTYTGDTSAENIDGLDGNDTIDGRAGADTLAGGIGNDTLSAGFQDFGPNAAADVLDGGAGDDRLLQLSTGDSASGGDGLDFAEVSLSAALNINGVQSYNTLGLDVDLTDAINGVLTLAVDGVGGAVSLSGVETYDVTFGAGNDRAFGGANDDHLEGDAYNFPGGNDELHGAGGNDELYGGAGSDLLYGDDGNDVLQGGEVSPGFDDFAADELYGGAGDDTLRINAGDLADGGAGTDIARLYLNGSNFSYQFDLSSIPQTGDPLNLGDGTRLIAVESVSEIWLGGGDNQVVGGVWNDRITAGNGADQLSGAAGDDRIFAGNNNDTLSGGEGNDSLSGEGGNDTLDGGVGSDAMNGGLGNDTYIIDSTDTIVEGAGQGVDTVRVTFAYTLGSNFENLVINGIGGLSGTGNALNNTLTGNGGGNLLDGKGGADTLIGGLGNDIFVLDNAGDVATENVGEGTDTIRSTVGVGTLAANVENLELQGAAITGNGNELNNRITGNDADNNINGGAGIDTMLGGLGNDTYFVDNFGDVVNEAAGAGTDTIFSTINIALLAGNIENLSLNGVDAVTATGNSLNNVITGNSTNNVLNGGSGEDTLNGGLGNDTYVVNSAGDVVTDTGGNADTIISYIDMATLTANIENLTLAGTALIGGGNELNNIVVGNNLNNTLTGGLGGDQLNGGVGADTMSGGAGDDNYIVENVGDTVIENSGEGIDLIYSFITISALAANVERLNLMPAGGAIDATANGLDNRLNGNDSDNVLSGLGGADVIQGLGGNDHIIGGAGQDNIFGGAGNDVFVYQLTSDSGVTGATRDIISDFTQGQDHIDLSAIDAITGGGDDAFSFIGAGAFTNVAGQLRYDFIDAVGTANDFTIVSMDVDGNGVADSQIGLRGLITLTGADFVL